MVPPLFMNLFQTGDVILQSFLTIFIWEFGAGCYDYKKITNRKKKKKKRKKKEKTQVNFLGRSEFPHWSFLFQPKKNKEKKKFLKINQIQIECFNIRKHYNKFNFQMIFFISITKPQISK